MGSRKRRRVERADDWEQLEILCAWDEQMEYEKIRPLVLFGDPAPERATETGTNPRLFATRHQRNWPQLKLFGLEEALGEGGWLKALELEEYAARPRNKAEMLQGALFPYLEAL